MDLKSFSQKLNSIVKKYRFAAIVLFLGIAMMCIPVRNKESPTVDTEEQEETLSVNEMLAEILSSIDGAGEVRVFLTVASGEETLYQTNESVNAGESGSATQTDTVTITDAQRNQTGLVRQINPPVYQGAIVVCQGADKPVIQLAIINAVSKVTGLGTNRISVLKMK